MVLCVGTIITRKVGLGKSNAILHAACGRSPPAASGYGPRSRHAARRLVARWRRHGSGTPRARASAAAASAGCARGHWLSLPPNPLKRGASKVRPVLASSPQAVFRALRAAQHSSPLLRLPRGGTAYCTLSAQPSADRSTRPDGRVAPASCWAASTFDSPVGPRNEPSLRFGLLAFAPSALYC